MSEDTQRCCADQAVGLLKTAGANDVLYCDRHAPAGAALEPVKRPAASKA